MLYKEMTADQRRAKYDEMIEALEIHADCFVIRPIRGRPNRYDMEAIRHAEKCEREAAFIRRVARSCGDAWAKS